MSVVQFQESMDSSADLQVWNNAAFDNEDLTGSRQSWGSLNSIFANPKASFDSVSDKENQGPVSENQISSSAALSKAANRDGAIEKSGIKGFRKQGFEENVKEIRDEKKIDEEIEEIKSQIVKLSSRLEALRIEKRSVKGVEKRGRVVPAKFKEIKIAEDKKIVEEIPNLSGKTKVLRRGISMGPAEIVAGGRRGMSMGPSEIFGGVKSKQLGKQELITPVQSRRKSCFWKLQDIDEDKVFDKRFKSTTVSPNSRKVTGKTSITTRQAVTTISSRKNLKKEDMVNSVQPKKLFKEGEKSVNKKPLRPGRVVASRYNNQTTSQASAMRKRSLPENEDSKRVDKKRSLSAGKSRVNETESKNVGTESRVKKRWEIPSEIVVHGSLDGEKTSPRSIVPVPELLPRLRIVRCTKESPRDSGPAKKVAELIGKKSFFSHDEELEPYVCQALTYDAEEDEESL